MTYPYGTWEQNPSGYPTGAWMYTGPVLFLPSNDAASTGMGVLVLGPGGGQANFPVMQQGETGPPPSLTFSSVQVAYGTTPQQPQVVESYPGVYEVTLYLQEGQPGATASFALGNATDLAGTATVGQIPMVSSVNPTAFTLTTPHAPSWYSAGPFTATASNVNTIKNIGSVAIPAKTTAGWLEIYGNATIVGAVDTQVNLVARIGTYTVGTIISTSLGQAGASPAPIVLNPLGLSASAGIVNAGTGVTVFLNAENQTASANPWSVAAGGALSVKFQPTT